MTLLESRKAFIKNCREKRMTYYEIGKLLGISPQRVQRIDDGPKSKLVPVEKIKIWNKKRREYLGLPTEAVANRGGLDFIRDLVRERDNNTCQICLKKWKIGQRRFDTHHLNPDMESKRDLNYDRNNMDKMITLCHKCHLNLESVKGKMLNGKK